MNIADPNIFRPKAEDIVQIDENEDRDIHGQRVSAIFHDADIIINADINENTVEDQVDRFCNLLFGSNRISPTKDEYGMFAAKAAALRTIDLSRQVGAAIFSVDGEVISMGSNEVPKAGGGTYWCNTTGKFDDRDYVRSLIPMIGERRNFYLRFLPSPKYRTPTRSWANEKCKNLNSWMLWSMVASYTQRCPQSLTQPESEDLLKMLFCSVLRFPATCAQNISLRQGSKEWCFSSRTPKA